MTLPAIVVIDQQRERCRALSHGLAEFDFEVVPVTRPEDGVRFASAISPWVIVTATSLLPAPSYAAQEIEIPDFPPSSTVLLLGDRPIDDEFLPDGVLYLPARRLTDDELVRRVRLLLLGKRLGLVADLKIEHLLGDLEQNPLFELLPTLQRARVSGQLALSDGHITLHRGEVVGAVQGEAHGVKAFLRLASQSEGPFRLEIGPTENRRYIELDLEALITRGVEETLGEKPDPATGLELKIDLRESLHAFEPYAIEVLRAIAGGHQTIGQMLDSLPEPDSVIINQLLDLKNVGAIGFISTRPEIAVVTDSSCDLPPKLAESHHIRVVPLTISFGPESFVDGVELKPSTFYNYLASNRPHPSTSPPAPETFARAFSGLEQQKVFSVHISSKLSQTLAHAQQAAATLAGREIRFLDSAQVSVAQGLLALFAARMALRGVGFTEILDRVESLGKRIHLLFVVDTLEYLAKGGRIGRAQAVIGKFLGIKPILGISDGEVVAVDRARGGRRAQKRLVELFAERFDPQRPITGGVGHAHAPVWADALEQLLREGFRCRGLFLTQIGPVVGTHAGPGTVGAALLQPTDAEWQLIKPLA